MLTHVRELGTSAQALGLPLQMKFALLGLPGFTKQRTPGVPSPFNTAFMCFVRGIDNIHKNKS